MPTARPAAFRRHLAPDHKIWLNWDGVFLMGPRYLRFLDGVVRTGTIRGAGKLGGRSYRTSLNRIREREHVLGARLLDTPRRGSAGGRARRTAEALRLAAGLGRWQRAR